jgi:hypothetical protein
MSLYLMALISLQRFLEIRNLMNNKRIRFSSNICVLISTIFCAIWPIIPLYEYSPYILDESTASCRVQWSKKSSRSFTIMMVYFLPILFFLTTNYKIYRMVSKKREGYYTVLCPFLARDHALCITACCRSVTIPLPSPGGYRYLNVTRRFYNKVRCIKVSHSILFLGVLLQTVPSVIRRSRAF